MITKFIYCLLLSFFFPGIVKAQNDEHRLVQKIKCLNDTTQQYALYMPKKYTPEHSAALLIFLDPAARGDVPVDKYRFLADDYSVIMAGSYNSRNFNEKSSVESFVAIYNDILRKYTINPGKIWIAGFSGGARAAASIAMTYPEVRGIIACGAGFANDEEIAEEKIPPYAAIVGDRDMNYSELMDNSNYLDEKKQRNILLTFQGEHTWPPLERFGLAIEWLLNESKDSPVLETNKGHLFFESVYAKLDTGYLYAAWIDAQQLGKIPSYRKMADSLLAEIERRKPFTADRDKFKQTLREEQNCMNDFSIAFNRKIYLNETTDDFVWTQKAKAIAEIKNDKSRYRQLAADRCFDHCIRTCQEYYYQFFSKADYKMAYTVARIWSLMAPNDPDPYYLMARTAASAGDRKQSKRLLEKAVKKGLVYSKRIMEDAALHKVLSNEAIHKIFGKD